MQHKVNNENRKQKKVWNFFIHNWNQFAPKLTEVFSIVVAGADRNFVLRGAVDPVGVISVQLGQIHAVYD